MKLLHSTTTKLNSKEFQAESDKIITSMYRINPDMTNLYDIHINFIDDTWRIDFLPIDDALPVIKVDTYTEQNNQGGEFLRIKPVSLEDLPGKLKFKESRDISICENYITLMDFVLELSEFEYRLS